MHRGCMKVHTTITLFWLAENIFNLLGKVVQLKLDQLDRFCCPCLYNNYCVVWTL